MLIKIFSRLALASLIFLICGSLAPAAGQVSPAQSQVGSRILSPVDNSERVTIQRSTHPLARSAYDAGPLADDAALKRMILVMGASPDQEHQLQTLLDSQQTKGSPDYHRWLTPDEFGARFGPSQQDIQQVTAWLQQQGFTVDSVPRSGRWIEFSGTAGQVRSAFGAQMRQYQIAGKTHIANAADISVPAALSPVVRGVASLHNFFKKPMLTHFGGVHRGQRGDLIRATGPDLTTTKGNHFLTPSDFATIYDINPLLNTINGAGQTIAIVARSSFLLIDVSTFRQTFGLAPNNTTLVFNGHDPGPVPGDDIEAILDAEWSGAVAPAANIDVVVSSSTLTSDGVDLSAMFIVDNNLAPIMSVSFGQCEKLLGTQENQFFNSLWQQAAAQGISVFVSSGDDGAAGCDDPNDPTNKPASGGLAVSGLASTPFDTAVGGTQFNETVNGNTAANFWNASNGAGFESAKGYIPEMVWNQSCDPTTPNSPCAQTGFNLFAGSGGASGIYGKPSWQLLSIPGMPNDSKRDMPDVSLTAADHDGYLICFQEDPTLACQVNNGVLQQAAVVGGTSASSPSFAGIMALINQKAGGGRQGLANYVLYNLAANKENFSACDSSSRINPAAGTSCIFNDTTAGNNSVPGQTGFNAVTGFDLATGLGSVDVNNLATAWGNSTFQATLTSITTSMGATVNITHGQSVTLTAQVQKSPSGAGPTGTVAFVTDKVVAQGGLVTVGGGNLAGTPATFSASFNNLPGGSYNLSAYYPGDGVFAASSSASLPVNVAAENSKVTLAANVVNINTGHIAPATTVAYGDPVNLLVFDANVASATTPGDGFPSGNVTFADGNNQIALIELNSRAEGEVVNCLGVITCLTIGTHSITASYPNGDNSFNASGPSNAASITVTKGNPQGTIVLVGQLVGDTPTTFLVGFKDAIPGTIVPSGSVQIFDGTTPLGSPVQLDSFGNSGGQLTITTGGPHTLTAQYSGDSTYNAATSQPLTVTPQAPFQFAPFNSTNTLSATTAAGGTATFNIQLDQVVGSTFTGTVAMTCSGAPAGATCSVNPSSANVSNLLVPVTVTVNTTTSAQLRYAPFRIWSPVLAGVLGILVCGVSRKRKLAMLMLLSLLLIVGVTACGGGGGGGGGTISRPPTIATLTVTGTSGSFTSSINLNLTITH